MLLVVLVSWPSALNTLTIPAARAIESGVGHVAEQVVTEVDVACMRCASPERSGTILVTSRLRLS